jgi:hypothetical protein
MEIKEIVDVLTDFIKYVDDFYNAKSGIYPIKGMTDKMVLNAVQKHIANPNTDFAADSWDREQVRDIILADNDLVWGVK